MVCEEAVLTSNFFTMSNRESIIIAPSSKQPQTATSGHPACLTKSLCWTVSRAIWDSRKTKSAGCRRYTERYCSGCHSAVQASRDWQRRGDYAVNGAKTVILP